MPKKYKNLENICSKTLLASFRCKPDAVYFTVREVIFCTFALSERVHLSLTIHVCVTGA